MGDSRITFIPQASARLWALFAALTFLLVGAAGASTAAGAQSAQNLAPTGTATQNSTSFDGAAERANDGNTSSKWSDGSVTATDWRSDPWWEVNIGDATIDQVVVWNRTDCCSERLKGAWVFVSAKPFGSKPLSQIKADSSITKRQLSGSAIPNESLDFGGIKGSYVRVQLEGNNRLLSLAEVQIFGTRSSTSNEIELINVEQSSTSFDGGPFRVIDGNTSGNWSDLSVSATKWEKDPWWQAEFKNGRASVDSVQVWNRTDCCAERLNDAWIFLSDNPFGTKTLAQLKNDPSVIRAQLPGFPLSPASVPFGGVTGRYVRIQLEGNNRMLSLAEVKVFGTEGQPDSEQQVPLRGPATQSSTSYEGVAGRAIDGNTSGNWSDGSVTATDWGSNPWWQTEFSSAEVTRVKLWNRTDCCAERLNGAWVFVSDVPFGTKTLTELLNDSAVSAQQIPDTASPTPTVDFGGVKARYVRVQLAGTRRLLSLAEVEVFAGAGSPSVTQSSTGTWNGIAGDAARAVDGNTDGTWLSGSVSSTAPGDKSPWWNVRLTSKYGLSQIEILNRTDCCRDRLNNLTVKVSTTKDNACEDPSAQKHTISDFDSYYSRRVDIAQVGGKYPVAKSVCIQKDGEYLTMAEVQFRYRDKNGKLVDENGYATRLLTEYYYGYQGWNGVVWGTDDKDIVYTWANDLGESEFQLAFANKWFRGNKKVGPEELSYCQFERHVYAYRGDDEIHMMFPEYKGDERRRCGHHVSGHIGSDTFDFVNVDNVAAGKLVVGRINDFDVTRDKLQIDGVEINPYQPPSNVRFVAWNGDFRDKTARPQLWIVITSKSGGEIFYTLQGGRYQYETNNDKGSAEKHFIKNIPADLSKLPSVPFEDVHMSPRYDDYRNIPADAMKEYDRYTDGVIGEMLQFVTKGSDRADLVDVVHGSSAQDYVYAGAGNDLIAGGTSYDFLFGQAGDDKIWGGTENDEAYGGAGNDTIEGNWGDDFLVGGAGDDTIAGNDGDDTILGDNLVGDAYEYDYWQITGGFAVDTGIPGSQGVVPGLNKSFDTSAIRTHQVVLTDDDASLDAADDQGQLTKTAVEGAKHPETGIPVGGTATYRGYYEVATSTGARGSMVAIHIKSNFSSPDAKTPAPVDLLVPQKGLELKLGDTITFKSNLITATAAPGSGYAQFAELIESPRAPGRGDDVLSGGAGRDTFVIGAASGNDVIEDFVPGEDTLIFVDVRSEFWSIKDSGQDAVIQTGGGTVRLKDLAGRGLGSGDFVFQRQPPT